MFEGESIKISWLSATDDGGSPETIHYNLYTYDKASMEYKKVNQAEIKHTTGLISYDLPIRSSQESINVVVTSATSATGDEQTIKDLSDVQNRFIVFYILTSNNNVEQPVTDKVVDVVIPDVVTDKVVVPYVVPEEIVVQPEIIPALHFEIGSTMYVDGSTVSLSDIGEGDAGALLCKTDKVGCCKSSLQGEFYYPDDTLVPVRAIGHPVYRNRGEGYIRLNYYGSGGAPTGLYRCEIPDSSGALQSISINIV